MQVILEFTGNVSISPLLSAKPRWSADLFLIFTNFQSECIAIVPSGWKQLIIKTLSLPRGAQGAKVRVVKCLETYVWVESQHRQPPHQLLPPPWSSGHLCQFHSSQVRLHLCLVFKKINIPNSQDLTLNWTGGFNHNKTLFPLSLKLHLWMGTPGQPLKSPENIWKSFNIDLCLPRAKLYIWFEVVQKHPVASQTHEI